MLKCGAATSQEQCSEDAVITVGECERCVTETRADQAEHEQPRLSETLGQQTGRQLEQPQCEDLRGANDSHLPVAEPEALREHRQQHVSRGGQAVLACMRAAASGQREFLMRWRGHARHDRSVIEGAGNRRSPGRDSGFGSSLHHRHGNPPRSAATSLNDHKFQYQLWENGTLPIFGTCRPKMNQESRHSIYNY